MIISGLNSQGIRVQNCNLRMVSEYSEFEENKNKIYTR